MKSALVVDDNDAVCQVLRAMLEAAGFHVDVAHDGEDAIFRLASRGMLPHVILIDEHMPKCDGTCLYDQLKRHKDYSRVPIIFMSADARRYDEAWVLALDKPITEERLLRLLGEYALLPGCPTPPPPPPCDE